MTGMPAKNMKTYFIAITLLFMTASGAFPDEKTVVTAETGREEVLLGDNIKLKVRVEGAGGKDVEFPAVPPELGEFDFVSSGDVYDRREKEGAVEKTYVLGIYTTGIHVIPPVPVKYKPFSGEEWKTLTTRQIPLAVKSVLSGDEKDIKGIKGLAAYGRGPALKYLAAVAVLMIIGILIAGHFLKRKKTLGPGDGVSPKAAHEVAYERLQDLKGMDLPGKGQVNRYYVVLSDIVRQYIEDRFSYKAPDMTTEEFLKYIKESPELQSEVKNLLKKFLTHCDMVKFARYGPTPIEMLDSFKYAEKVVDVTKLYEEEETEDSQTRQPDTTA